LATVRITSAVLVQMNGTPRSFQLSMKVRMASVTWRTEVNEARRMACRLMMEKNRDQVHPAGVGRGEVQVDAWVVRQPLLDVGAVVSRVVVDHDV
jgi:hypothetical protein